MELLAVSSLPAPVWFVLFFKVLGFVLHQIFMHLWLVALPLALVLYWKGCEQGRRWASRVLRQMPFFITYGVNFGIVPLLFIQLLYPQPFYTATILMAWHWMLVIVLLIPAYYGVYLYSFGLKKAEAEQSPMPRWRTCCGWLASLLFLGIGFLFVNALVLTAHPGTWDALWQSKNVAGAATGLGSAIRDAVLFPRWFMTFGLAFGTVAAWTLFDRFWLMKDAGEDYAKWTNRFCKILAITGAVIFTIAWCVFMFNALPEDARKSMFSFLCVIPTLLSLAAPIACAVALFWFARKEQSRLYVGILPAAAQLGSLALVAIFRQILQCHELGEMVPLHEIAVRTEFGAMFLFLGTFVIGAGVVVWMLTSAAVGASKDAVVVNDAEAAISGVDADASTEPATEAEVADDEAADEDEADDEDDEMPADEDEEST